MTKKNSQIILSLALFFGFLVIISALTYTGAIAGNPMYFNVSLTLNNAAPSITNVVTTTATPNDGTTKIVSFRFNATDSNGVGDIPATNANVTINKSNVVRNGTGTCAVVTTAGTTNEYECNISIMYWDTAGTWTINASIYDGSSAFASNNTQIFTVNSLMAMALKTTSLTFSGTPGTENVSAGNNPQTINNTGNTGFADFKIMAISLQSGANFIGAGNFTANVSNSAAGQLMVNGTNVTITGSNVSVLATQNLYLFLDIPAGITNASYSSGSSWVVTAE